MTDYTFVVPTIPEGVYSVSFTLAMPTKSIQLFLKWLTDLGYWYCYAVMPDTGIREFKAVPSMSNWSRYRDYDMVFSCPSDTMGYADLSTSTVVITDKEG